MPFVGYDAFFTAPGAFERRHCRVCGAACHVERSRIGPWSSFSAMVGKERPHDRFVCPHSGETWHDDVLDIWRAADHETDPVLMRGLQLRARRLLAARGISYQGE